jgi:mRNA interferase MazF
VICDFGDVVVVVPFPFVDRPIRKRRPSLVLSVRSFNETSGHSVLTMITTDAGTSWPSDLAVEDLAAAGLPRACVVRWKIFTLPNDAVLKKAGTFGAADREAFRLAARQVLG